MAWFSEEACMARRRRREEQGIFTLALKSGWQFSAILAGGCAFGALVLIPGLFAQSPILRPLGAMLSPLAWVFAGIFALIALLRLIQPQIQQGLSGKNNWS